MPQWLGQSETLFECQRPTTREGLVDVLANLLGQGAAFGVFLGMIIVLAQEKAKVEGVVCSGNHALGNGVPIAAFIEAWGHLDGPGNVMAMDDRGGLILTVGPAHVDGGLLSKGLDEGVHQGGIVVGIVVVVVVVVIICIGSFQNNARQWLCKEFGNGPIEDDGLTAPRRKVVGENEINLLPRIFVIEKGIQQLSLFVRQFVWIENAVGNGGRGVNGLEVLGNHFLSHLEPLIDAGECVAAAAARRRRLSLFQLLHQLFVPVRVGSRLLVVIRSRGIIQLCFQGQSRQESPDFGFGGDVRPDALSIFVGQGLILLGQECFVQGVVGFRFGRLVSRRRRRSLLLWITIIIVVRCG